MNALSDVAILMPAFNGQSEVERTLASFREASPVRVLIVDDGSTPPIAAPVIDGLDIEILRMAKNVGIERALQAGIDALAERGIRYAARIDAGDRATPGRLAKQRAYLEAHPHVAVLGMWTHVVATNGAPLFRPHAAHRYRRDSPRHARALMFRASVADAACRCGARSRQLSRGLSCG